MLSMWEKKIKIYKNMPLHLDDESLIFETQYWKVYPSIDQTYLGRSIIFLKRENCGDLADLKPDEIIDFLLLVKKLENACRKAFGAVMFNWACLMNDAYQNVPPDPQVHWHCRPRYNHPVTFAGHEFEDTSFGTHYLRGTNFAVDSSVQRQIISAIKMQLS